MAHSGRVVLVVALLAMLAVVGAYAIQAAPKKTIAVSLHLNRVRSEAEIEQAFVARSTPGSKLFLEHLSQEELNQLVGAAPSTIDAVTKYLSTLAGVRSVRVSVTNDVVVAHIEQGSEAAAAFSQFGGVTLGAARMLQVPVHPVKNPPRQTLPIPSALRAHLRMAIGIVYHDRIRFTDSASAKPTELGMIFPGMVQTPETIRQRYKIPKTKVTPSKASYTQGVAEFANSDFNETHIEIFMKRFNVSVPTINIIGPNHESPNNVEGTADLEVMGSLTGGGIPTWWVSQNYTSTEPERIDFTWWCNEVMSIKPQPPSVVTLSYGLGTYHYQWKREIMDADNDGFRKLGLLGMSLLVASGDSGPGGRQYSSCTKFMPVWPGSSPYVTSVGATYFNTQNGPEIAWNSSGGGFSTVYPRPSWQKTAVDKYLATASGLPKSSFYNASGRGYPDVAMVGTNYLAFTPAFGGLSTKGIWHNVTGTSVATPAFGAVISRINVERIAKGKKTLGFLNPQLYSLGTVGQDVTTGKSFERDCPLDPIIEAFPAVSGWDAVTGLGTPDYEFLLNKLG